jgi:hypothetical protein
MSRVVLGTDIETGQQVWIDDLARQSGLYLLGRPGMGKSAAAVNIALQDIAMTTVYVLLIRMVMRLLILSVGWTPGISQRPISLIPKMIRTALASIC